ncbi:NAD(P)-binding domain-containing protein [Chitinophaga varians]|uniref:NAD(P)-binding domain-containing protein n=1 Tax=Chitinophaga varians TaxID=2202339 RepID=A0A847S5I7_9BACT|nr:NAD(P)-binding domain-containing protein [Chitinophaga varians]NLR68695.1 NAD(P)-binding domain-containing protein [Chitinophaga varians]
MKIGIIGSGAVGQTLAKGFQQEGHTVTLGTRDTSKPEVVQFNKDTGITVADFETTAKTAELIVLSTKGGAAADALRLAGIANLDKKIVIDTTNPLAEKGPEHGLLHFFTTLEFSLMEQLQQLAPAARFVKAFNSVGNARMYKPQFSEGKPSMFICGNDDEAKKTVTGLLTAFGWETEDMGTVEAARAIEPLCILWCIPGFLHNSWSHAFKLLK